MPKFTIKKTISVLFFTKNEFLGRLIPCSRLKIPFLSDGLDPSTPFDNGIIYILNENRVFALVLRLKTRHFHEHGE